MSTIDRIGIQRVAVERASVISGQSFETVVAKLAAAVGHPDMADFARDVVKARTSTELERIVNAATGPAGLMQMAHFDIGEVLRKELEDRAPKSMRLVIGNPLIMKEMVKHVPDAASYAPVTVLVDERADGVHLSYDLMASLLAPYGNEQAAAVAIENTAESAKVTTCLVAMGGDFTSVDAGWKVDAPGSRTMSCPAQGRRAPPRGSCRPGLRASRSGRASPSGAL